MVVGRVDLRHVAADDLEACKAPHQLLRLAACEVPYLRRARCSRRIKVRTFKKRGVSNESPGPQRLNGFSLLSEYQEVVSDSLLVSDSLITSEGSLCGGPNALRSM
ncbi:hypothetical protein AVDCRST_MAG82-1704 [uncultured Rubrobacteraceae bacterium]|uniref:Uncharacterized protein n=1 Tax=uncultured Rubrobacteraceae bacterium TaxID=349277 RepID=A0A6J4PUL8_9ACTN|nr:hypothetical protein AVDCRST_MAG82-1704 [uncultured Rubrobacteraceae bacterium]